MLWRTLVVPWPLLLAVPGAKPQGERPNVVIVLADTLRADRLPFYGYVQDTAPFLASWAARSVVFERAWAASSWTAPATASVFTGVYPTQHGVVAGRLTFQRLRRVADDYELNRIPPDLETVPEFLRSRGYRTFGVASNPNVCSDMGFDQGFDRFVTLQEEDAASVGRLVAGWGAEIGDSQPYFLYLHFMDPHAPYERHESSLHAGGDAIELEPGSGSYDGEIRFLDAQVEEIFRCLGVDERTLVVFLADHGEEFGDHGGSYHGARLYSELIRIPLFIHQPGVEPRRVATNVATIDLLPTLRDILGAAPSEQDEGTSLRGLWGSGQELPERLFFSHRRGSLSELQCVISGDRKYIVTDYDPGTDTPQERELFDLSRDPGETTNLSEGEADVAEELDGSLRQFELSARKWQACPRVPVTPELLERLERVAVSGKTELRRDLETIVRHRKARAARAGSSGPSECLEDRVADRAACTRGNGSERSP